MAIGKAILDGTGILLGGRLAVGRERQDVFLGGWEIAVGCIVYRAGPDRAVCAETNYTVSTTPNRRLQCFDVGSTTRSVCVSQILNEIGLCILTLRPVRPILEYRSVSFHQELAVCSRGSSSS